MAGSSAETANLDPYAKPKPGKKPKAAAAPEPVQVNSRPSNTYAQRPQQGFAPPPAHQQKLMLCRYYESGKCERGSACWFAHGRDELRHPHKHASRQEAHAPMRHEPSHEEDDQQQCPDEALFKTRMCVYFQQGRCQRGTACTFAHDPAELQAYNPARRYAQQAQAHTMDTYLPQRLQDEAAATSLAREAAAAAAAAKPAKQPRVSSPTITLSNASQASGSQAPKAAVPVALYATQASQPYVTPMPVTVKSSSQANFPRDVQQEPPKAYKHPIESTADIGQGESVVQLEQGLDVLDLNDDEEDLEAPSSFCCPITTELLRDPVVAADGHTYERQHIKEWLQKSDTSPMTNEPMDHKHLIPNLALRAVMEAYFGARSEMVQ